MNKIKKILFVLLILILILSASAYLDYYVVKTRNTTPKISIKKDIDENLTVYNALLYRVWYCKTNEKYTIGDYKDTNAVCFSSNSYDESGNYTNKRNILIKKSDLDLISNYYSQEQISSMDQESIENAKKLAFAYGKLQYKKIDTTSTVQLKTKDNFDVVIFAEYILNNDNVYELKYDEKTKYCMNSKEEIAVYEKNTCGVYKKIEFDQKICDIYKDTKLSNDAKLKVLCKKENTN